MHARLLLRVIYDASAFDCRRVLRILPRTHPPENSELLSVSPTPAFQEERVDRFDNRVLHLRHAHIEREFTLSFEASAVENSGEPPLKSEGLALWKLPSRAVSFSPELLDIAREFRSLAPRRRAEKLNQFAFDALEYTPTIAPRPCNATEVWMRKWGTCADFSHVLLALGRAAGLPARYVAGFGPSPGALHAWVEFGLENHWHAFDPTHGTRAEGLYLPVAIGRDFYDCVPHQGSFRGSNAHLEMHCELK